jgi:hypothetical protein
MKLEVLFQMIKTGVADVGAIEEAETDGLSALCLSVH